MYAFIDCFRFAVITCIFVGCMARGQGGRGEVARSGENIYGVVPAAERKPCIEMARNRSLSMAAAAFRNKRIIKAINNFYVALYLYL